MRWHLPQPLNPGGLEANIRVEAPGYCTLDDGLTLFRQQVDEPLFGVDVALDALGGIVEVTDDSGLFGEGWERLPHIADKLPISAGHLSPESRRINSVNNGF